VQLSKMSGSKQIRHMQHMTQLAAAAKHTENSTEAASASYSVCYCLRFYLHHRGSNSVGLILELDFMIGKPHAYLVGCTYTFLEIQVLNAILCDYVFVLN
jgi:hypothetical protein